MIGDEQSASAERRYDSEDLSLVMDLGQRAALAIDNQRLYQASKQAVALRDEFLSVASHELRTPITSLKLLVQSFSRKVADGSFAVC